MYRFVGNDPGQPGALNSDYNPRFRTIATNFQAWPGQFTVTDEAPTQVAATALAPGHHHGRTRPSATSAAQLPQLLRGGPALRPQASDHAAGRTVTITGFGFGAAKGTVQAERHRDGGQRDRPAGRDTSIVFTRAGQHRDRRSSLSVTGDQRLQPAYNGISLQVLEQHRRRPGHDRRPTRSWPRSARASTYATIQAALEAARPTSAKQFWLVVVWPERARPRTTRRVSTPRT